MIKYTYVDKDRTNSSQSHSTFNTLQLIAANYGPSEQSCREFTETIIQFVINRLNTEKALQGLFRLVKFANKYSISPFLATQDYCVKILDITSNGHVQLNISPIYHLGPEYPEYYKEKEGKDLNRDAIIGLIEMDTPDPEKPSTFNLGIDAGIAFQQAKIPHNIRMDLFIQLTDDGIIANLSCEDQSTSKVFTWEQMGFSATTSLPNYSYDAVDYLWAT